MRSVRWVKVGAIALPLVLVMACGRVSETVGPGATPNPAGHLAVASDSDNGKTVNLRIGDRLEVRLTSTYWTIAGSSNQQVLKAVGPVQVSPQSSGCVPGGGCGTVVAIFDVVGTGSAQVTASRTSCGEAMGCTGDQGSFRVTVQASA
ncbi:MAG: hypothetical protein E6I98_00040 [Chloroflexi bacterium]|nr:MAG: hypothetical protein E6I98_00040 [Chloroflexota bacterium]